MVSIVIPAHNEENAIAETITSLQQLFANTIGDKPEIIVVNDGSTDNTLNVCSNYDVVVLTNPVNMGYGFSLKKGIKQATYDTIIIIDSDGTYPIQYIPELIENYNSGFDMVVAARTGSNYEPSIAKKLLRLFLKSLVQYTTNNKIPDINSGMRIFSKSTVLPFLPYLSNAFSFTTSITLVYLLNHKFVKYIPITYNKRVGQSKVKIIRDIFRTLQYIFEIILHYNPVKVYLLFFALLFIITVLLAIISLFTSNIIVAAGLLASLIAMPLTVLGGMLAVQFSQAKK